MGEEVLPSYLRNKLSSILAEAEADSGSPSDIISRLRSIEIEIKSNSLMMIPVDLLYELIELVSECRVFSFERSTAAVSKKGFDFYFPKRLLHPLSELMFNRRMRRRLDSIAKNIEDCTASQEPPPAPVIEETYPIEDPSLIIGFEAQAKKIEDWLMPNQEEAAPLTVVGIVGRCGCGKTALAQKVFASPIVKKEFWPMIWVSLSNMLLDDDRKVRVVNHILKEIGRHDDRGVSSSDHSRLAEELQGKRYLIVLDNAWRLDEWYEELFSHGLPGGGAVIVTSRRENVIRQMIGDDKFVIQLHLSDEFCWQIFTEAVQQQGKSDEITDQNLCSIRDDVTRTVDRLPLVAKTLANAVPDLMLNFKSYWIPARGLDINAGNDPRYWRWITLPPPQEIMEEVEEVAELMKVSWLKIIGTVELKKLLLDTSYSAYLVFKLREKRAWLHLALTARVRIICDGKNPETLEDCNVFIDQENPSQQQQLGRFLPQPREGEGEGEEGWMEIKLGDFFTPSGDDDGRSVEAGLLELRDQHWKSGLVVKGIELRWNANG